MPAFSEKKPLSSGYGATPFMAARAASTAFGEGPNGFSFMPSCTTLHAKLSFYFFCRILGSILGYRRMCAGRASEKVTY